MTITETLDNLQEWFTENLCNKIELKVPTDEALDGEVELTHPATFALYVPAKDRIPPNVKAPIPSLCIQLMDGEDKTLDHQRRLNIRLCFAVWNPGLQTGTSFYPEEDDEQPMQRRYHKGTESPTYTRNLDGWRDAWNFVDRAISLLESTSTIKGLRIVKEDGISYGPFTEDGAIWDYYPYWHSWIKLTLEAGLAPNIPDYSDLL